MTENDLLMMLIEVYEQGLQDGIATERLEQDRIDGWTKLKDRKLARMRELVTL